MTVFFFNVVAKPISKLYCTEKEKVNGSFFCKVTS